MLTDFWFNNELQSIADLILTNYNVASVPTEMVVIKQEKPFQISGFTQFQTIMNSDVLMTKIVKILVTGMAENYERLNEYDNDQSGCDNMSHEGLWYTVIGEWTGDDCKNLEEIFNHAIVMSETEILDASIIKLLVVMFFFTWWGYISCELIDKNYKCPMKLWDTKAITNDDLQLQMLYKHIKPFVTNIKLREVQTARNNVINYRAKSKSQEWLLYTPSGKRAAAYAKLKSKSKRGKKGKNDNGSCKPAEEKGKDDNKDNDDDNNDSNERKLNDNGNINNNNNNNVNNHNDNQSEKNNNNNNNSNNNNNNDDKSQKQDASPNDIVMKDINNNSNVVIANIGISKLESNEYDGNQDLEKQHNDDSVMIKNDVVIANLNNSQDSCIHNIVISNLNEDNVNQEFPMMTVSQHNDDSVMSNSNDNNKENDCNIVIKQERNDDNINKCVNKENDFSLLLKLQTNRKSVNVKNAHKHSQIMLTIANSQESNESLINEIIDPDESIKSNTVIDVLKQVIFPGTVWNGEEFVNIKKEQEVYLIGSKHHSSKWKVIRMSKNANNRINVDIKHGERVKTVSDYEIHCSTVPVLYIKNKTNQWLPANKNQKIKVNVNYTRIKNAILKKFSSYITKSNLNDEYGIIKGAYIEEECGYFIVNVSFLGNFGTRSIPAAWCEPLPEWGGDNTSQWIDVVEIKKTHLEEWPQIPSDTDSSSSADEDYNGDTDGDSNHDNKGNSGSNNDSNNNDNSNNDNNENKDKQDDKKNNNNNKNDNNTKKRYVYNPNTQFTAQYFDAIASDEYNSDTDRDSDHNNGSDNESNNNGNNNNDNNDNNDNQDDKKNNNNNYNNKNDDNKKKRYIHNPNAEFISHYFGEVDEYSCRIDLDTLDKTKLKRHETVFTFNESLYATKHLVHDFVNVDNSIMIQCYDGTLLYADIVIKNEPRSS